MKTGEGGSLSHADLLHVDGLPEAVDTDTVMGAADVGRDHHNLIILKQYTLIETT